MTFNINSAETSSTTFSFIPAGFDVYALAFQEVGPFVPLISTKKQRALSSSLKNHFGPDFVQICDISLIAIKLYVVINSQLFEKVSIKKRDTISTGADGQYGNKGACFCSFSFDSSTQFLFIAAHFEAHDKNIELRNQNFAIIMNAIQTSLQTNPLTSHHFIFFMGDLNYRIDGPYNKVKSLATAGKYTEMLEYDQLNTEKRAMRVFSGFFEEEIHFPPTYKFDKNAPTYATSKLRVPSFTDRILVYSRNKSRIKGLGYDTNMDLLISDHRPVFAKFIVTLMPQELTEESEAQGNPKSIVCNIS